MKAPCHECPHQRVTETYNCHMFCGAYIKYAEERKEKHHQLLTKHGLDDYGWQVSRRIQKIEHQRRRK